MHNSRSLLLIFFCLFTGVVFGQTERGGVPYGIAQPGLLDEIPAAMQRTEALTASVSQETDPLIISQPVSLDWTPVADGWQQVGPRWVFFTKISSPNAKGVGIILDKLEFEDRDRVFFYEASGRKVLGAFLGIELKGNKRFFPGLLPGDTWIVELSRASKDRPTSAPFSIARIDLLPNDPVAALGFDDALPCQINVNCPEGANFKDQGRSVVRVLMVLKEGIGWCSGSLMNNTAKDGRPFILTAFHCQDGYTPEYDLWRFDFNYEAADCERPLVEPAKHTLSGAQFRAGRQESDFLLLELLEPIPDGMDVWFNGWNRADVSPSGAALIHHPAGDIKKISFEDDKVVIHNASLRWNNGAVTPRRYHFQAILDRGTMEPGSSGGPLYDPNGYVIGQLHGGNANCDTKFLTYHGRMNRSWGVGLDAASRLADWLDPLGTEPMQLEGMANPNYQELVSLTGTVRTAIDQPLANVEVRLEGSVSMTTLTGSDGTFVFHDVPSDGTYKITAAKEDYLLNGVTAKDLSLIKRHLLDIEPMALPEALIAADVNHSGSVSVADIIVIVRLLLGIIDDLPGGHSWIFHPTEVDVVQPKPGTGGLIFTGIKMADINFSADPSR